MKSEKGLTMVELLVTITIIVFVATSLIVISDRALSQVSLYSKKVQASFLVEEAVEILTDQEIREKIRDDIEDDGNEWEGKGFWNVDYKENVDRRDDLLSCHRKLRINNDGYYAIGASENEESSFSRCVIIEASDSEGDLKVEVETNFEHKSQEISVNLYRIFYD